MDPPRRGPSLAEASRVWPIRHAEKSQGGKSRGSRPMSAGLSKKRKQPARVRPHSEKCSLICDLLRGEPKMMFLRATALFCNAVRFFPLREVNTTQQTLLLMITSSRLSQLILCSLFLTASFGAPSAAHADVVVDWNSAMTSYSESLPPPGMPLRGSACLRHDSHRGAERDQQQHPKLQ